MKKMTMIAVLGAVLLWGFSGTAFADHKKPKFRIDFNVFTGSHYPAPAPQVVYVQRVYVPPVYETQVVREFVTDGYRNETRTEVSPNGQVRRITVRTPYGHYVERTTQVLVREGYYQDVPVAPPAPAPRPAHTAFRIGFNVSK